MSVTDLSPVDVYRAGWERGYAAGLGFLSDDNCEGGIITEEMMTDIVGGAFELVGASHFIDDMLWLQEEDGDDESTR